jgi:malonyl-CoA decarboxylase
MSSPARPIARRIKSKGSGTGANSGAGCTVWCSCALRQSPVDSQAAFPLPHFVVRARWLAGAHLATEALGIYQSLGQPARRAFLDILNRDFSPDPDQVGAAADAYRNNPSPDTLLDLQRVVEPPRQELFRRLNLAPEGTRALVQMRSQVLREMDGGAGLQALAADLGHLLTSWFNRGFLTLQRIDWRSSASVLQKLIDYEAVHQIQGWHDLRRRLESDRRCYAFFHSALAEEPLIFIEVALTRGMSDLVQPLLDPDSAVQNPEAADSAIFYSITNCQEGLRGVPFGSLLIKQVVDDLKKSLPRIRTFATLSPIPGFRRWLTGLGRDLDPGPPDVKMKQRLIALCAHYLVREKRGREPLDSVARFHLKNGARLDRINWLADTSATGLRQSGGLMANYVYDVADLERNHELYARSGQVVCSRRVQTLAKQAELRNQSN